jgi:hypothetical protein
MSFLETWRRSRWRRRFMGEAAVLGQDLADGRAPDATVDEVDVPDENVGFDGRPIRSKLDNGYGTGNPNSSGWAGWGA